MNRGIGITKSLSSKKLHELNLQNIKRKNQFRHFDAYQFSRFPLHFLTHSLFLEIRNIKIMQLIIENLPSQETTAE